MNEEYPFQLLFERKFKYDEASWWSIVGNITLLLYALQFIEDEGVHIHYSVTDLTVPGCLLIPSCDL